MAWLTKPRRRRRSNDLIDQYRLLARVVVNRYEILTERRVRDVRIVGIVRQMSEIKRVRGVMGAIWGKRSRQSICRLVPLSMTVQLWLRASERRAMPGNARRYTNVAGMTGNLLVDAVEFCSADTYNNIMIICCLGLSSSVTQPFAGAPEVKVYVLYEST